MLSPSVLGSPAYLMIIFVMIATSMSCQSETSTGGMISAELPPNHSWVEEASFQDEGTVMSIWGAPPSQQWGEAKVWAVGGQPDQGLLWERVDGTWRVSPTPDGELLNWIHGRSGHLWIVGNGGRALRKVTQEAEGNGEWEVFDTGTTQDLWGVWVRGPNDVWAVGGDPVSDLEPDPILLQFDGTAWTRVMVPDLDRSGVRALFKIYGEAESGSLFAVGMKGVIIGNLGEGWQQQNVTSASELPPSGEDLVSLWGDENGILAVGGRSNGVLARWDGEEWTSTILAGVPGLNGVWVDTFGMATAVGVRGATVTVPDGLLTGERERNATSLVLHATWGRDGEIWAVGGSLDRSPPWTGVIVRTSHRQP